MKLNINKNRFYSDLNRLTKRLQGQLSEELYHSITVQIDQLIDSKDLSIDQSKVKEIIPPLINGLLTVSDDFFSDQDMVQAYTLCKKKLSASEILLHISFRELALQLAHEVAKTSEKYFFLDTAFPAYRIIYTILLGKEESKQHLFFQNKFFEYINYYRIEKEIEIERNKTYQFYNNTKTKSHEIRDFCESVLIRYKDYEQQIPSFYFHVYYYLIAHVKHLYSHNQLAVYKNAENALKYFQSLDFNYVPGKLIFSLIQITSSIQLKEFNRGSLAINRALKFVRYKSAHWFNIKENELLLLLHSKEYEKALGIYFSCRNSKNYKLIRPLDLARWDLYEPYVHFLIEANHVTYKQKMPKFRINRFLNSLPNYASDKRAMNIPMLIAQMLFLIIRKKYDEATNRISALERYSSRYLKDNDTFRSNCFIKMLLVIPKQGFNKKAVERHAKKYHDRLINSEIQLIDQPFEIEIIPYEHLWEILLEFLSNKGHYRSRNDPFNEPR